MRTRQKTIFFWANLGLKITQSVNSRWRLQVIGLCMAHMYSIKIVLFYSPEMVKRNTPGIAIGGLSGGEEKSLFWKTVSLCTDLLPKSKPRYLMGVG